MGHQFADVVDDVILPLGVEDVVAGDDVAVEEPVLAGEGTVNGIGGFAEGLRDALDAEYGELEFAVVFDVSVHGGRCVGASGADTGENGRWMEGRQPESWG